MESVAHSNSPTGLGDRKPGAADALGETNHDARIAMALAPVPIFTHAEDAPPERIPKWVVAILAVAAGILTLSFALRTAASWRNFEDIDHNSVGTIVAIAADVRDGILYRDTVSDIGYGGTRYAPLSPVLHAGLMRAGLNPITSGYILSLASLAIVLSGLFLLMRQLKVPAGVAGTMTLFALAATCFRTTALEIKPDLMPLGLNLWGLWLIARSVAAPRGKGTGGTIVGAILFALAQTAKVTSIYGLAAAFVWLVIRRHFGKGMLLATAWAISLGLFVGLVEYASGERAIHVFRLCGQAGGFTSIAGALRHFWDEAFHYDRAFFGFLVVAALLVVSLRKFTTLPTIFLIITGLGTVATLASPGTRFNHLVDLNAAALLCVATISIRNKNLGIVAMLICAGLTGLASVACYRQAKEINHTAARTQMMAALADANHAGGTGPILSEHPLLPILNGERPYMIDSFMFRVLRERDPAFADRFWNDLATRHFKAVILHYAPGATIYDDAKDGDYGPGFIERLNQTYSEIPGPAHGRYHVFVPKPIVQ